MCIWLASMMVVCHHPPLSRAQDAIFPHLSSTATLGHHLRQKSTHRHTHDNALKDTSLNDIYHG